MRSQLSLTKGLESCGFFILGRSHFSQGPCRLAHQLEVGRYQSSNPGSAVHRRHLASLSGNDSVSSANGIDHWANAAEAWPVL